LGRFEQQVDFVNIGTTIQLHPNIRSNGDILLNIDLSLSNLIGYEKRTDEDGNEYDVPNVEAVSLSTQATVPDGRTVLIGGAKSNKEDVDGQIVERNLLILIKPEIIVLDTGNDNSSSELPADLNGTDGNDLSGYFGGYGGDFP
jgi:type II secretory pathway component GspD/PulD (secretin)